MSATWLFGNNVQKFQFRITYALYIDGMKMFPVKIKVFVGRWGFCFDVSTIYGADCVGESRYLMKHTFNFIQGTLICWHKYVSVGYSYKAFNYITEYIRYTLTRNVMNVTNYCLKTSSGEKSQCYHDL